MFYRKPVRPLKDNVFLLLAGLFTADQKLDGDRSIYTRQNRHGTARGMEVPEERDYYPYWGPTPWKDIAILVSDEKTKELMKEYVNSPNYGIKCKTFYRQNSFLLIVSPLLVLTSYSPFQTFALCQKG